VTRRARHAEPSGRRIAANYKADRQTFGIASRPCIGEIAVALQLILRERYVNVETAQGLEPYVGDHHRALACRIKEVAFSGGPALISIGQRDRGHCNTTLLCPAFAGSAGQHCNNKSVVYVSQRAFAR
jgi:hypothetical protein